MSEVVAELIRLGLQQNRAEVATLDKGLAAFPVRPMTKLLTTRVATVIHCAIRRGGHRRASDTRSGSVSTNRSITARGRGATITDEQNPQPRRQ
jgi:hypothetical protein